jgi:HAD superfamily hydrolase (TIGR01490 family)
MAGIAAAALERDLLPLAHPGALELVRAHLDRGEPTFAVTGALADIVEPLTRRLGIHETIATVAAVDAAGLYSGAVERSCHGSVKAAAVTAIAEERGIDLAASAAYGDSASDLPVLELVGRPHAVNPDKRLARVAAERGWPVLTFG